MKVALIGLGAIGVPIAHRLFTNGKEEFFLIADEERKQHMSEQTIHINNDLFKPQIYSELDAAEVGTADLLIVCVKNYALKSALKDIEPFVNGDTVIMPLQNGIFAYEFFSSIFPDNIILRGYVQGPNTEKTKDGFKYQNSGDIHIGSDTNPDVAESIVRFLQSFDIPAFFESNIVRMVWKKWMLNIAGNSVTALTGADYSLFKLYPDLQTVCRQAMEEFLSVALEEGVQLTGKDTDDVIEYYVSYVGSKKTSMLMDVTNERKTENDYLAGTALQFGKKHGIAMPIISTLYYLMEIKEEVYMEAKGVRATSGLFTVGVSYSDALKLQMADIGKKMSDKKYAASVSRGLMPEQLRQILEYAVENSRFYSSHSLFSSLQDFPVMNKATLKAHYDKVLVDSFRTTKTHKMYTSGSTGIQFTVIQDLAKRERNIADLKYFGTLAGYTDHDPMCYLRAKPTVSGADQERDNIWQLDTSRLSGANLADYFHVLVEKKCTALIGYASTLEIAVEYWASHFTNESSIRTIISTSEALSDTARKNLRAFFGENVGIYARYSNAEQGILGQEIDEEGYYHLNWASYYFEILKMDSDEPAADGELGRVVITDLYNHAFPMIRYDTGDLARFYRRDHDSFPGLIDLQGRQMVLIYTPSGDPVSPFLICRTMRFVQGIDQWQFIQETKDTYTLRIMKSGTEELDLQDEIAGFKEVLGCDAVIKVEFTDLPTVISSQRWKLIVSNIKQ